MNSCICLDRWARRFVHDDWCCFFLFIHSLMYIDVRFFFRFKIITPDPTHPDQLNFPSKSVHDLGNKYPVIKVNLSGGVYYIYSVYFCHRISKCLDVLFVHFVMHLILPLTSRSVRLATTYSTNIQCNHSTDYFWQWSELWKYYDTLSRT